MCADSSFQKVQATLPYATATIARAQSEPFNADWSELLSALATVVAATVSTYDATALQYARLRGSALSDTDRWLNDLTLSEIRTRRSDVDQHFSLLDIGAGYGRDVAYLNDFEDISVSALEASREFHAILRRRNEMGEIRLAALYHAEMTNLSEVPSNHFHCVRMHAALHHLPILPFGLGADAAIREARRVARHNGVLHCLVKRGNGVGLQDTGEGLGPRFFQYYSASTLSALIERHGFTIKRLEQFSTQRGDATIPWIFTIAANESKNMSP